MIGAETEEWIKVREIWQVHSLKEKGKQTVQKTLSFQSRRNLGSFSIYYDRAGNLKLKIRDIGTYNGN